MKVLGLTGGIGMGKSTVASVFAEMGVAVADTDQLAREVVQHGQPAWHEIASRFGPQYFCPDGTLNRSALGALVFADPTARECLENITHPRIRCLWQAQVKSWHSQGRPLAVVVIPLLFETKAESSFNAVICVACQPATQWARLRDRGWTDPQIEQRLAAQLPIRAKVDRAQFVLWNEAAPSLIRPQLESMLRSLNPELARKPLPKE
jgi:dephospho-CoA kinase